MKIKSLAIVPVLVITASAAITSSPPAAVADVTTTVYGPTTIMTAVTANIGREYTFASKVSEVMNRIKSNVNDVSNGRPRFLGWQEIGENDPDGVDEMGILKDVYRHDWGWDRTLNRELSTGELVPLKVPEVAHDAQKSGARIAYGADPLGDGGSPTRWITITRFSNQNISFINTHFISRAWDNCIDRCDQRRARWRQLWGNLQEQVAAEHNAGFNVILTGDFNRTLGEGAVNWTPAWIHPDARHVKNGGVDHIIAVPRSGWKVVKFSEGAWWIGIDGHEADWVRVQFLQQ